MIHIGQLVKEVYDRQPRSCTATWFARQINCHRANVYDIFARQSIDSGLLERISIALNHNFFQDLADDMARRLTPDATHADKPIATHHTPPPDADTLSNQGV